MQNKIAEPPTSKHRFASPVIPLTNRINSENDWRHFTAQPERAFANVYSLSGYVNSSRQTVNKIKLIAENKEEASWNFQFKADRSTIYFPEIRYDRNDKFQYRCTCVTRSHMCFHVKAAFDWLEANYTDNYFAGLKDWSKEKAKLLEFYRLKPEDEETKQIEFYTDYYGRLQMKAPEWLWGKNAENNIISFKKILAPKSKAHAFAERPKLAKEAIIDFETDFLFNFLSQHFKTGFELEPIKVFDKGNGKQFKKLSIHNAANLALLKELPDDVYNLMFGFTDEGVKKYLTKNGHGYVGNYANPWINLSESTVQLLHRYYLGQLEKLWPYLCNHRHIYRLIEGNFSNKNIQPAQLSANPVSLGFFVEEDERFIFFWQQLIKNKTVIDAKNVQIHAAGIFIIDDVLHLPLDIDDLDIVKQFKHDFIKIPLTNKLSVITNIIPALQKKYNVQLPPSLKLTSIQVTPKPQVLLKEFNTKYLMLQPQFVYDELTVDYESNPEIFYKPYLIIHGW